MLLIGAVALSGCGLKYDLYLPEDKTNPQNQAPVADAGNDTATEAVTDDNADSFWDDDTDAN